MKRLKSIEDEEADRLRRKNLLELEGKVKTE